MTELSLGSTATVTSGVASGAVAMALGDTVRVSLTRLVDGSRISTETVCEAGNNNYLKINSLSR